MIIDLLSSSNYIQYNVQLANLLGLNEAIYLGLMLDINSKAIKKDMLTDGYFTLDRDYITKVTTFEEKRQLEIEKGLVKLEILNKDTSGNIKVNAQILIEMLSTDDAKLDKDIHKILHEKANKKTKAECVINNMKSCLLAYDRIKNNSELLSAYENWVDAVYARNSFLTKASIDIAIKTVDNFANGDLDRALMLLQIAIVNGHRDINWSIEYYNKNYKQYQIQSIKPSIVNTEQLVTTEVF